VEEFLLLGEIPGTDIVVTFSMWMMFFGCLFALGLLAWARRHRQLLERLPQLLAEHIAL
jgi:hypothetical protein